MFDLFAVTQVHNWSNILGFYDIQGRYSSFVVHSFVLDVNHSNQRNNFYPQKVQYSSQHQSQSNYNCLVEKNNMNIPSTIYFCNQEYFTFCGQKLFLWSDGSDTEQMSERQRMKTFPGCRRHLEWCFDSEPVYLQIDQTWKHIKSTRK